jgi:hypothetical protein
VLLSALEPAAWSGRSSLLRFSGLMALVKSSLHVPQSVALIASVTSSLHVNGDNRCKERPMELAAGVKNLPQRPYVRLADFASHRSFSLASIKMRSYYLISLYMIHQSFILTLFPY